MTIQRNKIIKKKESLPAQNKTYVRAGDSFHTALKSLTENVFPLISKVNNDIYYLYDLHAATLSKPAVFA